VRGKSQHGSLRPRASGDPVAGEGTAVGWWGRIREVLARDAWLNLIVVAAVVVGFFHGWIKLKFRHPATTFVFDALLMLSLLLCFLRQGRRSFFPNCAVTRAALVFYGIALAWFFVPSNLPWVVKLASLRAWCFPSLMFVLGYHLTRGVDQVKGYFRLFILLGVVTAAYGMTQSPEEIQRKSLEDEYFAKRYAGVYYQTKEGKAGVRIFSTFVSAGARAGQAASGSGLEAIGVEHRGDIPPSGGKGFAVIARRFDSCTRAEFMERGCDYGAHVSCGQIEGDAPVLVAILGFSAHGDALGAAVLSEATGAAVDRDF